MNNTFYRNILPSQGVYCVTSISKTGIARNIFAESIDDLLSKIEAAKSGGNNVFVALNSFKGHSRKADNALHCRSFFVDLDIGESKGYATQEDAIQALNEFVRAVELPSPIRVDSGHGIHAYWPFDDDVSSDVWQAYAEKFKQFCISNGLKIDPSVTADISRVLRCPDTYNYKQEPYKLTRLLDHEITQYSFEAFAEFLGEIAPSPLKLAGLVTGLDDDSAAIARKDENFEHVFADLAIKSLEGQGCAQIKYILENAKNLPEPLWYAGLSVAVRCVDGETAIHDMSIDYEGYSRDETIRKADQSLKEATWAHGCDAFNRLNPDTCNGCPFRGKVTSPIRLCRKLRTEEEGLQEVAEERAEAVAVREEANPPQVAPKLSKLPPELYPYVRGITGGIFYIPPPKVDKDGIKQDQDPVKLFTHDVIALKRVKGGTEGDSLILRAITPNDPEADFVLPIRGLYVQDEMRKRLPENGVYPALNAVPYVANYFFKWAEYLQNKETADIMRNQMGWLEDHSAFVIGSKEITASGKERNAAASPGIKNSSKLVHRAGSFDIWKEHAAKLNRPGWELHAFAMLCGLGSPLMTFTPIHGATVCYVSANSGTGKTGSLYAAMSVFAKPHESCVLEGNATDNAYIGRYLAYKNMMFGVDEVSNIHPEMLSKLIHRISQGKAKLRMQSSVNSEREIEQSASMIAMFTSNKDLYETLRTFKGSPDGEMARLMQFQVRKPPEMEGENSPEGRETFNAFNTNYGHAGPELIKYIYSVGVPYAMAVVNKWCVKLEKDFTNDSAYRHYIAVMAAAFAGGELAIEAGIINYDLERIYNSMMVEVAQLKDSTVKLNKIDYKSLLSDFIHKNHAGFLVLEHDRVISEPRMALVGRIEVHNSLQLISTKEFKTFLAGMQISAAEFEKAMKRDGIMVEHRKCRLSTGWKTGMVTPPIAVYAFKSDALPEIVAKQNEPA